MFASCAFLACAALLLHAAADMPAANNVVPRQLQGVKAAPTPTHIPTVYGGSPVDLDSRLVQRAAKQAIQDINASNGTYYSFTSVLSASEQTGLEPSTRYNLLIEAIPCKTCNAIVQLSATVVYQPEKQDTFSLVSSAVVPPRCQPATATVDVVRPVEPADADVVNAAFAAVIVVNARTGVQLKLVRVVNGWRQTKNGVEWFLTVQTKAKSSSELYYNLRMLREPDGDVYVLMVFVPVASEGGANALAQHGTTANVKVSVTQAIDSGVMAPANVLNPAPVSAARAAVALANKHLNTSCVLGSLLAAATPSAAPASAYRMLLAVTGCGGVGALAVTVNAPWSHSRDLVALMALPAQSAERQLLDLSSTSTWAVADAAIALANIAKGANATANFTLESVVYGTLTWASAVAQFSLQLKALQAGEEYSVFADVDYDVMADLYTLKSVVILEANNDDGRISRRHTRETLTPRSSVIGGRRWHSRALRRSYLRGHRF